MVAQPSRSFQVARTDRFPILGKLCDPFFGPFLETALGFRDVAIHVKGLTGLDRTTTVGRRVLTP